MTAFLLTFPCLQGISTHYKKHSIGRMLLLDGMQKANRFQRKKCATTSGCLRLSRWLLLP